MDKQNVLNKIKAMLRTASNDASTEHEADTALRMAQQLMARYNVNATDVTESADVAHNADKRITRMATRCYSKKPVTWESGIANFVCEFVGGIKFYYLPPYERENKSDKAMMVFYGEKHLIDFGTDIYNELKISIATFAKMKFGSFLRSAGRSYGDGFVSGLRKKFREQHQQLLTSDSNALIVRSDLIIRERNKAAENFISNTLNIKLQKGQSSKTKHYHNAYSQGQVDGKSYSLASNAKIS